MKPIQTSLFVTTYNWPDALYVCLKSILAQTVLPDEIIISDDGSTNETREVIEEFKTISPVPINHLWVEDKGYRINLIRNLAINAAKHPFIIQIDGDVILDKNFVKDHLKCARVNRFNIGRRVRIDKEKTEMILKDMDFSRLRSFRNYMVCLFHQHIFYSSNTVRGLRGCNVAFWKSDALNVNGYDEKMLGKGRNDKEFGLRVLHTGVKGFNLRNYAICYHLNHKEQEKVFDPQINKDIYDLSVKIRKTRISNGIEKLYG